MADNTDDVGVGPVLVTGASGYIASHVVHQLQQQGYRVRGTVRNTTNETKIKPLMALCPSAKYKLELVEANLLDAESWTRAVEVCSHVIHVASPTLIAEPKHEDELIKPAVEGTLNVLRACQKARVKRVVLTSSLISITGTKGTQEEKYTEEMWTDPNNCLTTYAKSKTLAEKAAWEFVHCLPDGEKIELAVINPSLVLGPLLCRSEGSSTEIIRKIMQRELPMLMKLYFNVVDVRDVALAHVRAMTVPEANGHRHILNGTEMSLRDIANAISKEFKSQGYNIPLTYCPYPLLWIGSLFDKTIAAALQIYDLSQNIDNTRMKEVLGIKPSSDSEKAIVDMCYTLVEHGIVKKTAKFKPRM